MDKMIDYIPKKPKKISFKLATKKVFVNFCYLVTNLFSFYEQEPCPPKQQFPDINTFEDKDAEKYLNSCWKIFDSSRERTQGIQTKAQQLLGFISLLSPILIGTIAYIFKQNEFLQQPYLIPLMSFFGFVIIILFLTLWAILRCISVKVAYAPFVFSVIDPQNGCYKCYSAANECVMLLDCAIYNEVMNDLIAEYLRAAQYLFGLALTLLLIVLPIIIYLIHPIILQGNTQVFKIDENSIKEIDEIVNKYLQELLH